MKRQINTTHSLTLEQGMMKDLDSLHRYIDGHFRKLFGERKQARVGMLGTERKTYVGLGMP